MGVGTKIEWASATWNPIVGVDGGWGCNKVSPGCDHCYAEILHKRFGGRGDYESTEHKFTFKYHILWAPWKRRKPTAYFVCSTMDLFHHNISDYMLMQVFLAMHACPWHRFMILTKRPERMAKFLRGWNEQGDLGFQIPYKHIWLGVSAESQKYWDKRVPILMSIPAAVHFVSAEPLLGPINPRELTQYPEWVIIGCESGHKRRPCELQWVKDLEINCRCDGSSVFIKQIPINGKVSHDMEEWPQELRMRETPNV